MMGCRKISELCNAIIDCPHSTPKWQKEGGKRVIRNFNLRNGHLDFSDGYFVDEETFKNRISRGKPEEGDIVFSREAPMGVASIIPGDIECCLGQRLVLLKVNREICSPEYLNYCISSDFVQKQINRKNGVGSIVSNLTIPEIKELIIPFIPLSDQIKLVTPIVNLDRKISLNRSINAELERMAKEIYDYWFVQFEFPDANGRPYKSSGGKMVYNPVLKREVPQGWEVKTIGDEALIRRGSVITEKEALAGNVKVVAAGINYSYMHNQSNRKANVITISTSGANAGYMNFWREPIYASDCMTIECDNDVNTLICYYNLWHFREIMLRSACGSAQPHVYPYHIEPLPFIKATNSIIKKFEDVVIPINKDIAKNEKENEELIALRDELLPLLMTGQVKIK